MIASRIKMEASRFVQGAASPTIEVFTALCLRYVVFSPSLNYS
jgi:hypothetical protein